MDKSKINIEFPDTKTIESQIETIVFKGIKQQQTFYGYLKNMYKDIGLKYLFHDIAEIVFVILSIVFVLLFIITSNILNKEINNGQVYSFIFIASPILYLAVSLISFINTKLKDTYEIEMICKYNIYQISSFRMLAFSILGVISNTMIIYFITVNNEQIEFFKAFMISITSLFLFSIIFLYTIMKISGKLIKHLVIVGWITINLIILSCSQQFYDVFLKEVPIYIYLFVTIIASIIYIKNLKKLIKSKRLGECL